MKTIIAAGILLVAGLVVYTISGIAQAPALAQRVARLRAEIDSVPTTASNYNERIATLQSWGNDLATRRRLLAPQDLMSAFYRLPTVTPQSIETVARWTKILSFLEDNGGRTGTLRRIDHNQLVAGEYSTVVLEYTVGEAEIPKGDGIRLGQIFISNRPRPQITDPGLDSYVTFKVAGSTATTEPYTAYWQGVFSSIFGAAPMPGLRVTSGSLKRGDKVTITIGDTSRSSKGYRPMPRDADDFKFLVEMDPYGGGPFVPAAMVSTKVFGDQAAQIEAVAPSVVAVGESFAVRLRIEDQYLNPARFDGGSFQVSLNGKAVGEIKVAIGQSAGRLDGVKIAQEGGYKFQVSSADGRFNCVSNPVLAERAPKQRVYWGELHGHSGWEEGTGSVPRYYEFARDFAFLDFGSLTGHDVFLSEPGWNEIRRETEKANRPGSFVAYMGYEWTQTYDKGGHHNVFFKQDKGRYVQYREAPRPDQLYARLREMDGVDNVLIIPHAHEAGDWNYNDADMQRLVEIYSGHGSFEYFGQRFLRRGYRLGVIAASDDHSGHPGLAPALVATRGGLAAVYSPTLDRDGIWKGMKSRATYATSGKRPVIAMTIGGKTAGDSVPVGTVPAIHARVLATAAIDRIDVMRNGEVEYSKDYLAPAPGEQAAAQIVFFSSSETPGDKVMPPMGATYWGGWIEIANGRIGSIEPLGLDSIDDQFHQVDDRRVWFWSKTRGDFDGVMIRFAQASAETRVTVRLSTLVADQGGTGVGRGISWPSGAPSLTRKHEIGFRVDELARQKGFEIAPNATIFARKATRRGTWDASFDFRPTKPAAQNDYYYLRVVQVDGETAWSSPVWIGEEKR